MIAAYRILNNWYSFMLMVGLTDGTALEISLFVSCKIEYTIAV